MRHARVVALLKPENDPSSPINFRPISLLCHFYKLYERLVLNRMSPTIEHVLIRITRAGWLPSQQILHCPGVEPQHIEYGFETENHWHSTLRYLSCLWNSQPSETAWEGLQHDNGLPPDVMCITRTQPSFFVELEEKRSRCWSERAYRKWVSYHHFSSTYTQATSLLIRARAALYVQTTMPSMHRARTLGLHQSRKQLTSALVVPHYKPAPRESDKDASQPLPYAESRMWQTAQHLLERCEPNPLATATSYLGVTLYRTL